MLHFLRSHKSLKLTLESDKLLNFNYNQTDVEIILAFGSIHNKNVARLIPNSEHVIFSEKGNYDPIILIYQHELFCKLLYSRDQGFILAK